MSTELVKVQESVSAMEKIETGLAQMRDRFVGRTYDVSTAPGMTLAKADRAEVRELRFEVERARKAGKAPLLALGKWADQTAARITTEILKIETPIDVVVKAEEDRVEAEKQARIEAEIKRVAAIRERITEMQGVLAACASSSASVIREHKNDIAAIVVDESFAEFATEAQATQMRVLNELVKLHDAAVQREAERVELARLRAEQEERDRVAREAQAKADSEAAAKRAEEDARLRREREQFEHDQARARQRQADEDRRLADERAEVARQQEALRISQLPKPSAKKPKHNPGSEALIDVIATHYSVEAGTAGRWLREIDWEAVAA